MRFRKRFWFAIEKVLEIEFEKGFLRLWFVKFLSLRFKKCFGFAVEKRDFEFAVWKTFWVCICFELAI